MPDVKITLSGADLTSDVVKKVNAELEKLGLTGDVAQKKIQKSTADSVVTMGGMKNVALELAGAFGIGFGISSVVGWGKALMENLGHLEDLHEQTSISLEDLQRMGRVGKDAGIGVDEMALAAGNLSKRLIEGTANTGALGLSTKNLIAAGPKEAFLQVAEAVGRINDPMLKNSLAADMFGEKLGRRLVPALSDLRQRMSEVPKEALFTDEDIAAADAFGESIEHISTQIQTGILRDLHLAGQAIKDFYNISDDRFLNSLNNVGQKIANLKVQAAAIDIELLPTSSTGPELTRDRMVENEILELRARTMEHLTTLQQRQVASLHDWGKGEKEIAERLGVSVEAVHRVIKANADSDESWRKLHERLKQIDPGSESATLKVVGLMDAVKDLHSEHPFMPLTMALSVLKDEGVPALQETQAWTERLKASLADIQNASWTAPVDKAIASADTLQGLGTHVDVAAKHVETFRDRTRGAMDDVAGILSNIEGEFAQTASVAARTVGSVMDNLANQNPVGAVIAGVTGGIQVAMNLFRDEEAMKVNDTRDAYVSAAGGLHQLNVAAFEATGSLQLVQRLLNARHAQEYEKALDDLNAALERQNRIASAASSRFGPSRTELQALATEAAEVYEFMRTSGQFSAEQIAEAFKASQEAQIDAIGGNTKATKEHLDTLQKGLADLTERRDAIWQQIAQEAPEEAMGIIEAAQRAQVAVMDDQIAAQAISIKDQAEAAAKEIQDALSAIKPDKVWADVGWRADPFPTPGYESPEVPSYANEAYDLGRPHLARIGDARGDTENVMRGQTVREVVAGARRQGAASLNTSALENRIAALQGEFSKLSDRLDATMRNLPIAMRHAMRGA